LVWCNTELGIEGRGLAESGTKSGRGTIASSMT